MKNVRIAVAGFGNVARAFLKLLAEKEEYLRREFSSRVILVGAAAGRGAAVSRDGLDFAKLIAYAEKHGRLNNGCENFSEAADVQTMTEQSGAEIFIELTPLTRDGEPASTYIKTALKNGCDVITANKGPVAWRYNELRDLAEQLGKKFLCETVVMDGTPLFNMTKRCLRGNKILELKGILNATTNFILSELERGITAEHAVAEAQRRGFAEADPSFDTEGHDGAAKIAALANILMDAGQTPADVKRVPLFSANYDLPPARDGMKVKYICGATLKADGSPELYVKPCEIPADSCLATVSGRATALTMTADLAGEITIIENSTGILQTAHGVYSDLLYLLDKSSAD